MSGTDWPDARFVLCRRAPTCAIEIFTYDKGISTVFPVTPFQALALAETLMSAANARLAEIARADPMMQKLLTDPEAK